MQDAPQTLSENPFNPPAPESGATGDVPIKDESTKYIVLGILELIFCGGLFAVVPLFFAFQYKDAVVARDVAEAARSRKKVRTALVAVLVISLISIAFSLFLLAQSGFFETFAENYAQIRAQQL